MSAKKGVSEAARLMSLSKAAAVRSRPGVPLTEARAVTAAEAHKVQPLTESTTETMMPWDGWFSSFLKTRIGEGRYDKLRQLVLYRPDDIHSLEQMPKPTTKVPISKDGKETAMFRYPSPGSQAPVRMPQFNLDNNEDPYNNSYYTRDTGRRKDQNLAKLKVALLPQDDPRVAEMVQQLEAGPSSSPGNKGTFATGPSDFDTTGGLRATMSTNNAALEASLDANMPDHLPKPTWWNKQDEIVDWHESRGLPVPIGGTGFGLVPREGRIARW
jgi:hypothetical protein